jgi:hypothetical protein
MRTRLLLLPLATISLLRADEPQKLPIAPTIVKVNEPDGKLAQVMKQINLRSGMPVTFPESAAKEDCPVTYASGAPFWEVLESVADRTGQRIVLHDHGRKIALEPRGKSREISCVTGPFRVVAREVIGRNLLDLGLSYYEVRMDLHWEPRFPVFRIDTRPKVTQATDDRGIVLGLPPTAGRTQLAGTAMHETSVRLTGLTRESRKIGILAGEFTVTAAEKMLAFKVDDLTAKTPISPAAQQGVSVVLKRFEKDEKVWEAEIEVTNPPGGPVFESFESWTGENQIRLISPNTAKSFAADDYEIRSTERKLIAVYRFKEDAAKGLVDPNAKGWSLVYTTPSPLVEFKVPFEIKDIPLP